MSSKRPSISSSNAICYHGAINMEATDDFKVKTSANRDSEEPRKTLLAAYYLVSVVFHKLSLQSLENSIFLLSLREQAIWSRYFEVGLRLQSFRLKKLAALAM